MHLLNSINVILVATVVVVSTAPTRTASAKWQPTQSLDRQRESRAVEGFLKSLQLDDLLVEHLEMETSRETHLETRRKMAARLLNEYGQRMMAGQSLASTQWQAKAVLLLETYPELSNPAVQIAILQSDYLRAENEFQDWWSGGRSPNLQAPLISRWNSLKTNLETLNRRLYAEYDDQVAVLQSDPQEEDDLSRRLARIDALLLHTEYLLGWSSYFMGILGPQNRRSSMLMGDAHFRKFLEIDPQAMLTEVPPEWFDFSSTWNIRALAGLAMCQRGLNHPLQSKYCFELIENHAASQQTRDLRLIWDLNSRVYVDEVSAAQEFVDEIGLARSIPETGRTSLWLAVLDASGSMRNRAPVVAKRLLRAGLLGLARQFDAIRIREFMSVHKVQLEQGDFVDLWINGLLAFDEAQSNVDPLSLQHVKSTLTEAVAQADESTYPLDVTCCRFLLAKIQLRERAYEAAAQAFQACSQQFENDAPELSAESLWLAARALSEHSRTHSRNLMPALRAIDELLRRFPGSTYAKRAEFEKLRLNVSGLQPTNSIAQFQRVPETDANYPLAVNEIVKLRYRSWLQAHQTRLGSESLLLNELMESQANYELVAPGSESRLKTQLLVIDALLRTDTADNINAIRQRMENARSIADAVGATTPVFQEYRYYVFLLANRVGDPIQAVKDAQWLTDNAPGTQFEKSAYVQLAQQSELRLKSLAQNSPGALQEITEIYAKLVDLLGSAPEDLKASVNARVALSRLAELRLQTGASDEAIEIFTTLNQLFPNHKSYLRLLAKTLTDSNQYSDAIPLWRKLSRGIEPGSDAWLESKYHLALCLYRNGNLEEARRLHQQTCRLCPDVPESWNERFEKLSKLIDIAE